MDWLDDKYDLGYLDEILGSSDGEKKVTFVFCLTGMLGMPLRLTHSLSCEGSSRCNRYVSLIKVLSRKS